MSAARVLLVEPGDVLVFSNVGDFDAEQLAALGRGLQPAGIHGVFFSGHVDLSVLTRDQLAALMESADGGDA